jgi:Putative prokaryotic signal transducing protein
MADDLRTVATFATPINAALARNALADAGIDAAIADELTLTADPFLGGALGFIKVQVRQSDLERAADVLARRGEPIPADFEGNGHAEPVLSELGKYCAPLFSPHLKAAAGCPNGSTFGAVRCSRDATATQQSWPNTALSMATNWVGTR